MTFNSYQHVPKLVLTVCATGNYCYAMKTLARRIAANLSAASYREAGTVIIAGDNSEQVKTAVKHWKGILPTNWTVIHLNIATETKGAPNYKKDAQTLIAKLRTAAFTEARRLDCDYCWSLDSDTLPPSNALRCMADMLVFDDGYYSVSTCPYPNESFLGGRGTPQTTINQDFLPHERVLTEELKAEKVAIDAEEETLKKESLATEPDKLTKPSPEWLARMEALNKRLEEYMKKVMECPPDGNVFQVNGKYGWRQRGWFEHAYPGIGLGSVVPSDWCGFGCTLMTREALSLAVFDSYEGQGTEDLFIIWRKWYPAGLRINCIAHCPCDHVIWDKKKGGDEKKYTLIRSYHEGPGEYVGHLRTQKHEWVEY